MGGNGSKVWTRGPRWQRGRGLISTPWGILPQSERSIRNCKFISCELPEEPLLPRVPALSSCVKCPPSPQGPSVQRRGGQRRVSTPTRSIPLPPCCPPPGRPGGAQEGPPQGDLFLPWPLSLGSVLSPHFHVLHVNLSSLYFIIHHIYSMTFIVLFVLCL